MELTMLNIGTYNILIPRPDINEKGQLWVNRKERVVDTIVENFDLVGLQEVDVSDRFGQSDYVYSQLVAAGFSGYVPNITDASPYLDEFHSRVQIFWKTDKLRPLALGSIQLSGVFPGEEVETPIVENRYASYGVFETNEGVRFLFVTLHLQHGLDHRPVDQEMCLRKQRESMVVLRNLVESIGEQNVLLVGDFNNVSPELTPLCSLGLVDVADLDNEFVNRQHATFHNWDKERDSAGGHIDKVLVRGDVRLGRAEVVLSHASDHYPIRVELFVT
jgi:endonuclease/exonuclease/phosphatase family metal-dependent hydrolase